MDEHTLHESGGDWAVEPMPIKDGDHEPIRASADSAMAKVALIYAAVFLNAHPEEEL